jgi:myo-inositol-1(or 4)-monophosphatase
LAIKSAIINVMERAARTAARGLLRDLGEVGALQVSEKGPANFVSAADVRAEKTIRAELEKARPEFGFLLEEGGAVKGKDREHRWVVDPLDGTTTFLHGIPHFAISIALERLPGGDAENAELVAGLILDPALDEMFWAEKGQGAFLNDRRIRVSSRKQLRDSLIATGIPTMRRTDHQVFLARLSRLMEKVAAIHRAGAASLDLAWVAAGRYDGFFETGLSRWDVAAGILLVREAGGFITEFGGGGDPLGTGSIVAATPALHPQLLTLFAEADTAKLG